MGGRVQCIMVMPPLTQQGHGQFDQGHVHRALSYDAERTGEPGGQILTDPDNQVRVLKPGSIRRAQRKIMRRRSSRDQQIGIPYALHHHGDQRVHRGDIGHDKWHLGHGGCREQTENSEGGT